MDILIRAHHLSRLLVLYLVNMLPIDGRTKRVASVIVVISGLLSLPGYPANF